MKRCLLPVSAFSTRSLFALLGLAIAVPTGCGSMRPHNAKDDTTVEVDVEEGEEPPHIDNCPELCAEAYATYAPLSCDVSCDINLGTTVDAGLDVAIINLLSVIWFDADAEVETGETCDVVIECPDLSDCHALTLLCLNDSDNAPDYCIEEYLQCEQETMCNEIYQDCGENAWEAYNNCEGTYEECWTLYDSLVVSCAEQYDFCLGVGDEPAPPPPLPTMTDPGRYDVPMSFIQHHLDRLATLDAQTFTMLMPADDVSPAGIAVHSIDIGDPVYQLGLRDGDVVIRVNDTPILSFSDSPTALLGFLTNGGVKLTIRRNGQRRDIRYRFVD